MRILIAAVLASVLVAVLRITAWLLMSLWHIFTMVMSALPAGTVYLGMLPGIVGIALLWRTFKTMEHPVSPLRMFQGVAAVNHHRRELRSSVVSFVCLAIANPFFGYAFTSATVKSPWLLAMEAFTGLSLLTAAALMIAAWLRIDKASWFTVKEPLPV